MQNIKNNAVNTNKLSTEISHFLDAHNFSYCPNPHNSYLGKILELVKDIYKVQSTRPYTNQPINPTAGAITILGKFFSNHLNIINIFYLRFKKKAT
mgnify:FL=1